MERYLPHSKIPLAALTFAPSKMIANPYAPYFAALDEVPVSHLPSYAVPLEQMDYDNYRAYKAVLLKTNPLRLDCMNPEVALNGFVPPVTCHESVHLSDLAARWRAVLSLPARFSVLLVAQGVRRSLDALFTHLAVAGYQLWLPHDTYPVYWMLAKDRGLTALPFKTIPLPDLTHLSLATAHAALVITNPLMPHGRELSDDEVADITKWLKEAPARRVILDGVYQFGACLPKSTEALLATQQTLLLHSMTKSFASRLVAGAVIAPPSLLNSLKNVWEPLPPTQYQMACHLLRSGASLPVQFADRFTRAWNEIKPRLNAISSEWKPPACGYFSIVPLPAGQLYRESNILGVPATVFGSSSQRHTIVSSLHLTPDLN